VLIDIDHPADLEKPQLIYLVNNSAPSATGVSPPTDSRSWRHAYFLKN